MNGDQSWIVAAEEPRRQRAVILHVDDLGMCPGANRAFLELAAAGQVTCGSVMVPCPAFRQIAEAATADPTLDLGVHLTLTSEWERLPWAPLSTRSIGTPRLRSPPRSRSNRAVARATPPSSGCGIDIMCPTRCCPDRCRDRGRHRDKGEGSQEADVPLALAFELGNRGERSR